MKTMTMTLKERQALVEKLPWVRRLKTPAPCCGYRSGRPLKAIFSMHGKPPIDDTPWRCKIKAKWHFTSLMKSWPQTGDYCWVHLTINALYGDQDEQARTEKWLDAHPDLYPPKPE